MYGHAIQTALSARGYDPGPINGVLEPRSYGALFNYSARRKLGVVCAAMAAEAARLFPAYTYRGGGCIQSTGKAVYFDAANEAGLALIEHPDLSADPADSVGIAAAS